MKTIKINKQPIGEFYAVIKDSKPVLPIHYYLLHLNQNGYSKNSIKTYAFHLMLYWEWLELNGLDYHTAIGVGTDNNATVIDNLGKFKFWLKYPDYNPKLIPINGIEAKREASTINQIMNAVLGFYDFTAMREGFDRLNIYTQTRTNVHFNSMISEMTLSKEKIMSNVFKEKEQKKVIKYITRSQYEQLWSAATNQRNRIIVGLLFEGGMRVSEVIGLRISDLAEINKCKIRIENKNDPNNPDAYLKYDSKGYVYVTDTLAKEINDYLINTIADVDTDYLIINLYKTNKYSVENIHKPMKRDTVEDMIERLGKKVGIEGLHPHMLRHGIAVDMLQKGCPMIQIKDKLRHKNLNTTSDIYAEFDDTARKQAMANYFEKVDEAFHPDDVSVDELYEFLLEDMED